MSSLKTVLKEIDKTLNKIQPKTMDELISVVHSVPGAGKYGTHFSIVKYMGYLQGVRVFVTARKNTYELPSKSKVYATMQGTEKFEAAGWPVIHETT